MTEVQSTLTSTSPNDNQSKFREIFTNRKTGLSRLITLIWALMGDTVLPLFVW